MRRLLRNLVSTGAVSQQLVNATIAEVGERRAERELLRRGAFSEEQYARALALTLGLSYVDLNEIEVDQGAVALLPAELCRRHGVLPIAATPQQLTLAMTNPEDILALDDVTSATGRSVRPVLVTSENMQQAMDRFVRHDSEIADLSSELDATATSTTGSASATETLEADDEAPIVRFVNLILSQGIQDRASDIHIDPTESRIRVRYRIDGVLKDVQDGPLSIRDGVISRLKVMSGIDIAERRKPQDGRISVTHNGRTIDLRVATLPTVWGEKIVMRILDNSSRKLQLSDLDMSQRNVTAYTQSFSKPHGMVLVTGPTGSGKSTTLYTTLAEVARPEINVLTIEDPVEYRMEGIGQMQVNTRAGMTFAAALRAMLRGDPDVVLVGEIRDGETAQIAIEAALTGHLLLSTLHTNDAPSAVTRLTEMGIEPFLVASALEAVVAQRLARRLCRECMLLRRPEPAVIVDLGFVVPPGDVQIGEPQGCSRCSGTGYRGRVALHEVMQMSEQLERMAVAHASGLEMRKVALEEGMISLREDGWQKVLAGVTSIEEVLRVAA